MRAVVVTVRIVVPVDTEGRFTEDAQAFDLREVVTDDLDRVGLLDGWVDDMGAVITAEYAVEDVEEDDEPTTIREAVERDLGIGGEA